MTKTSSSFCLMKQVTVALMISLLARCILAQNPDSALTQDNFTKLVHQLTSVVNRMAFMERSIVYVVNQLQQNIDGLKRLEADLNKLNTTVAQLGPSLQSAPTQDPEYATKENFSMLRSQILNLTSTVEFLVGLSSISGQQQCPQECQSLASELSQLNTTMQSMESEVKVSYMNQESVKEELNELTDNITQLSTGLQVLEDSVKLITARGDLISEDGSSVNKVCPHGFHYSKDGFRCYMILQEFLTWEQARSRCAQMAPGAQLVTVTDAGKNLAVTKLIDYFKIFNPDAYSRTCSGWFWTAGRQLNEFCSAEFFWQPLPNAFTPLVYTNWIWEQPDCETIGATRCIHYGHGELRAWNDSRCYALMCAICEYIP